MLEKHIQSAILEYLQYRGHYVWRNNSGMLKQHSTNRYGTMKTRMVKVGKAGSSDIIGVHKDTGQFLGVEVKQPGKKPTALQQEFMKAINYYGGIAIVATSVDDVINAGL